MLSNISVTRELSINKNNRKSAIFAGFLFLFFPQLTALPTTETQICDLYLEITETAVDYFEPLWTDYSYNIPDTGFFDFSQYANWQDEEYAAAILVPGNGMVAYCYAVLLTHSEKTEFGIKNVPRVILMDHAVKAIRFCSMTSAYAEKPYAYPFPIEGHHHFQEDQSWNRPIGNRIDSLGWLTLAVGLLWDDLNTETKKSAESLLVGNAAKQRHFRGWVPRGGGRHDTIKQDFAATVGAAFLFPHRTDQDIFYSIITGNAIGMVATEHDMACKIIADGRPVSDWSLGWNLYPDYSSDHHYRAHIWYGCDIIFEARSYAEILGSLVSRSIPETFSYPGNGFDGVLDWTKTLFLPVGEPASVHGVEYDSYYGAGVLAYCYGAVVLHDKVAAALERHAAHLLHKHTKAIRMYDYHRNSWAKAATAFLIHKYKGPGALPISLSEAWRQLKGTFHFKWQQAQIHRASDKWASFSWGSISAVGQREHALPKGYIVPAAPGKAFKEPLIYFHPDSLRGSVIILDQKGGVIEPGYPEIIYKTNADDISFSTAGEVNDDYLKRHYAFHSFENGPCILFTKFNIRQPCGLKWSGLPIYFYDRHGMASKRRYADGMGNKFLNTSAERTSSWWNVNGLFSLVMSHDQIIKINTVEGSNWARSADYRDKCQAIFVSPLSADNLKQGDSPLDLMTAFYTGASRKTTKEIASNIHEYKLYLPQTWAGVVLPDQKNPARRYLAVNNLVGHEIHEELSLSFAEGAPVLSEITTIRQKTGSLNLQLEDLESYTDILELYLDVSKGNCVQAHKESRFSYLLEPLQKQRVSIRVLYAGPSADSIAISNLDGSNNLVFPANKFSAKEGFQLILDNPVRLVVLSSAYKDTIGPAVEIKEITTKEDGRVRIEVAASDQSKIKYLELYCDSVPVDRCLSKPFVFTHKPNEGWHSYWILACDDSASQNIRRSFKRTIKVGTETSN